MPPPHPSFCFPLGPISKGCSTTACSAVGAGTSKVPPPPPYLSPPSISLTLTSLFLFGSQKKAQHFPAWKVVRLPQDPPRSHFGVFCTFSCSAVFPLSLPTLLHPPSLCLHVLSPTNCYFSRLTVVFLSFFSTPAQVSLLPAVLFRRYNVEQVPLHSPYLPVPCLSSF